MKVVTDYEFKAKLHIVEEVPTGYDMAKLESTEAEFDARIDEQVKELIQTYMVIGDEDEVCVERIKFNTKLVD